MSSRAEGNPRNTGRAPSGKCAAQTLQLRTSAIKRVKSWPSLTGAGVARMSEENRHRHIAAVRADRFYHQGTKDTTHEPEPASVDA